MKKRAALLCAAGLALAALTGCSGGEPERTAEEWTDLYVQAITNHGGEMVEYNPVISRRRTGPPRWLWSLWGWQRKTWRPSGPAYP